MADNLTPEKRSKIMSSIKGKNTKPELVVRSIAHRMGFRFRLHRKDLPGKPDLVFKRFKKVIFVHGCFWHQHRKCPISHLPTTNTKFWEEKFKQNHFRDEKNKRELKRLGWGVLTIWECETKKPGKIIKKLEKSLNSHLPKHLHKEH